MCLRKKDKVVRWGELYELKVESGQNPNDKHGLVHWGLPLPSIGSVVLRGPNQLREQK